MRFLEYVQFGRKRGDKYEVETKIYPLQADGIDWENSLRFEMLGGGILGIQTARTQNIGTMWPVIDFAINDLGSARSKVNFLKISLCAFWDQTTYLPMPPGQTNGAAARGRQLATLSRLAHEKFTNLPIHPSMS